MLLATRSLIASVGLTCVAALALAACATASSPPSGDSMPVNPGAVTHSTALPAAQTAPSRDQLSKETLGMLPPVIVVAGQTEATAEVGNTIVINSLTPTEDMLITDRPDLLEITQGSYDGSAWFNPGAVVLGEGTATLTLIHAGESRTIVVTTLPTAR
jgi:hypothetical protein